MLPVHISLPLVRHDHDTLDPNKYATTTLIFHLIISFPAGNHRITRPCKDLRRAEPLTSFMTLVNIPLKFKLFNVNKKGNNLKITNYRIWYQVACENEKSQSKKWGSGSEPRVYNMWLREEFKKSDFYHSGGVSEDQLYLSILLFFCWSLANIKNFF